MATLDDLIHENVRDLPNWIFYALPGLAVIIQEAVFESVTFDEIEPGNRPLKIKTSIAYASLGSQNISTDYPSYQYLFAGGLLDEGFKSVADQASQDRKKYWSYQSDNGAKFWAEGPYYLHYALRQVIPFWHAVRGNGLLNFNGRNINDPFSSSNSILLGPLSWLANISTPDGKVPPLDDGNKVSMSVSSVLRWNSSYGDYSVGNKFAAINEEVGGVCSASNLKLVELAIPRRSSGNMSGDLTDSGGQQFVIRHTDGNGEKHYILFNKEAGNAIKRGEGHEQPDQMQLLYYINNDSYLVDGGYDAGSQNLNSSWNGYFYNNAMHYSYGYLTKNPDFNFVKYQNYGGLESPGVSLTKARKVSNHAEVTNAHFQNISDHLKAMEGEIHLNIKQATPYGDLYFEGDYKRRIVTVLDDSPYIVDFNAFQEMNEPTGMLQKMHYYGNSDYLINQSNIEDWSYWEIPNNNPIPYHNDAMNLYIAALSQDPIDEQESYGNDLFTALELDIQEYENRVGGGSKVPYSIKRKVYAHSNSDKNFGLITYIKAANQAPTQALQELSLGNDVHAGFYAHGNYCDVAILRTSNINQDLDFTINQNGISISEIHLPAGNDYGFVRFQKNNGIWKVDSDYQINLERTYPITASISGPTNLDVGQQGTWTVDASSPPGAPGSFSYEWYLKSDDPQSSGYYGPLSYTDTYSTQMYDFDNYLDLKVIVTRSSEVAAPIYHVFCNDCGTGGGGPLFVQSTSEFDPSRQVKERPDSVQTKALSKKVSSLTEEQLSKNYAVSAPYPNPFNPVTVVPFVVPDQSHVKIQVYNMLGRKVATLADQMYRAGRYKVSFNARKLSSGIYFIRTQMNNQIFDQKVTLIK